MEQRIEIERLEEAANLFGSFDENIRLQLEEAQRLRHPRHRQGHTPGQLPLVPRRYFITSIP